MSGIARGMRAFREAKERAASGSGRSVYNLKIADGEEVLVRFSGLFRTPRSESIIKAMDDDQVAEMAALYMAYQKLDKEGKSSETVRDALLRRMAQEEPAIGYQHWIRGATMFCAEHGEWEGIAGCVPCHLKNQGAKIQQAREVYGFSVFDYRKYHKISKGEDVKAEYEPCTSDTEKCKYCARAKDSGPIMPARVTGLRQWIVGKKWATLIIGCNDSLSKRCVSCGQGRIKVQGYVCGNPQCGEELADIDSADMTLRCVACSAKTYPQERLECTKCDNPVRGSISDLDVLITRSGASKDDTTYNLQPQLPFSPFPEEYRRFFGCVNWAEALKPISTAQQAQKMGLKSDPFGGNGGRAIGGGNWDDEEETERKPAANRSGPPGAKPRTAGPPGAKPRGLSGLGGRLKKDEDASDVNEDDDFPV